MSSGTPNRFEAWTDRFDYRPILLVCPHCRGCASMTFPDYQIIRVVCPSCGWSTEVSRFYPNFRGVGDGEARFGDYTCSLWLVGEHRGRRFFAYNFNQLAWMRRLIAADHRMRRRDPKMGWHNGALDSRLPRWMLSKKNRRGVLRAFRQLEQKRLTDG